MEVYKKSYQNECQELREKLEHKLKTTVIQEDSLGPELAINENDIQKSRGEKTEGIYEELETIIGQYKEEMDNKIDQYKEEIDKKIDQYKEEIDKKIETLKEAQEKRYVKIKDTSEGLLGDPKEDEKETILAKEEIDNEKLIEIGLERENENYENDKESIQKSEKAIKYWGDMAKSLKDKIESAEKDIEKTINESREVMGTLLSEFESDLKNSQQGLDIIGRMFKRIVDPGDQLNELIKESETFGQLKRITRDEWENIFKEVDDEEVAEKALKKQLDTVGMYNYRIIAALQENAEKREKKIMKFIETQILPILDGIIDGLKHSKDTFDNLKTKSPEKSDDFDRWLDTYKILQNKFLELLKTVKINVIKTEPGSPIDYERHRPFDVCPDTEMEDEQIKDVVRDGYEYRDKEDNLKIIRPAQVLVVKN